MTLFCSMIYIAVALWYTVTGKPKTETAIKMNFVLQKQLIKNSAPVYTTVPLKFLHTFGLTLPPPPKKKIQNSNTNGTILSVAYIFCLVLFIRIYRYPQKTITGEGKMNVHVWSNFRQFYSPPPPHPFSQDKFNPPSY